jgi:hypothetical protein
LLFAGAQKGKDCLQPLGLMAEQLLALPPARQPRLLWRLDAGFGTDAGINWRLSRRCRRLVKGFNHRRAQKVIGQVPDEDWIEVGPRQWAAPVPNGVRYARRTETLALDWFTGKGKEKGALLLQQRFAQSPAAMVRCYNARGGMETAIRNDKVGLPRVQRRNHAWPAQAAWVVLTDLAHNLLQWTDGWRWHGSAFEGYGALRLVQDLLTLPGRVQFGGRQGDRLEKVAWQRSHPYARKRQSCWQRLFRELQP